MRVSREAELELARVVGWLRLEAHRRDASLAEVDKAVEANPGLAATAERFKEAERSLAHGFRVAATNLEEKRHRGLRLLAELPEAEGG